MISFERIVGLGGVLEPRIDQVTQALIAKYPQQVSVPRHIVGNRAASIIFLMRRKRGRVFITGASALPASPPVANRNKRSQRAAQ